MAAYTGLMYLLRCLPEPVPTLSCLPRVCCCAAALLPLAALLPAVCFAVPACLLCCARRSDLEPNWVELPEMHPAVFMQGLKHRNWTHPEYK